VHVSDGPLSLAENSSSHDSMSKSGAEISNHVDASRSSNKLSDSTTSLNNKWDFLLLCDAPWKKRRYKGNTLSSVGPAQKLNTGENFAIPWYVFIKLSNYLANDNMYMMMPNSLFPEYLAPFC